MPIYYFKKKISTDLSATLIYSNCRCERNSKEFKQCSAKLTMPHRFKILCTAVFEYISNTVQNCFFFLMLRKMEHAKCNNEKRTKNIVKQLKYRRSHYFGILLLLLLHQERYYIYCTLCSRELKICYCARSAPLTHNALEFHHKSSNQLVIV